MTNTQIENTIGEWNQLTDAVLRLEELSLDKLQALLKETYHILTVFHKRDEVPKSIARLLLCIEEFLYFTSVMEDNEKGKDFYCWQELYILIDALKKGFFAGQYAYEFPKLLISDIEDNSCIFDLEQDHFEAYVGLMRSMKAREH